MAANLFDLYPGGFDPVEYSLTHGSNPRDEAAKEVLAEELDSMHVPDAIGSILRALPATKETRSIHSSAA